jgi:hypothetical protein
VPRPNDLPSQQCQQAIKINYMLLKFVTKMQPLHQKYEREKRKLCHVNMLEMKRVFPS